MDLHTTSAINEAHRVTRELSAIEDDKEVLSDKEYVPLNTRLEENRDRFNRSIIYWNAKTGWRTEDIQVENSNLIFEDQTIPYRYEVPEQVIDDWP